VESKRSLKLRLLGLLVRLVESNRLQGFSLCEDERETSQQMIPAVPVIATRYHVIESDFTLRAAAKSESLDVAEV
jgi:hypothetical protein